MRQLPAVPAPAAGALAGLGSARGSRPAGHRAPRRREGRGRARAAGAGLRALPRETPGAAGRAMTDASSRKEGFKKCRSATFSIDGYSFTIGENFAASVRLPAWADTLSGGARGRARWGSGWAASRGGRVFAHAETE